MSLFDVPSDAGPETEVTCIYGEPIAGPHPLCAARVERDCAAFHEKVALGVYDAEGYTPKERRAQAKRLISKSD